MGFIRLFLALTVAGDHFFLVVLDRNGYGTRGIDQWVWLNGGFAVMLFYTISGFLISYALAHKYQEAPGGTSAFYRSRFVRIFSLYWPMLIFAVALHRPGPEGLFDWLASVFIIGGDWITAFRNYPAEYNPYFDILGPIWSVAAELAFYAIAPFLLRSLQWTIALFIGSLMLRLTLQSTFGFHQAWTYHFFPSAFWCFMAGDLARRIGDAWLKNHQWVGALMLLSGIVSLRISTEHGSWTGPWFYIMILSFAAALPSVFDRTKDNRLLNFLGDLTYPIYLIHGSVITFIFTPFAMRYGLFSAPILVGVYVLSLIVLGAAVHFAVEQPFATALRWLAEPWHNPFVRHAELATDSQKLSLPNTRESLSPGAQATLSPVKNAGGA